MEKEKKLINVLTVFLIFHKNDIKIFLKLIFYFPKFFQFLNLMCIYINY